MSRESNVCFGQKYIWMVSEHTGPLLYIQPRSQINSTTWSQEWHEYVKKIFLKNIKINGKLEWNRTSTSEWNQQLLLKYP